MIGAIELDVDVLNACLDCEFVGKVFLLGPFCSRFRRLQGSHATPLCFCLKVMVMTMIASIMLDVHQLCWLVLRAGLCETVSMLRTSSLL